MLIFQGVMFAIWGGTVDGKNSFFNSLFTSPVYPKSRKPRFSPAKKKWWKLLPQNAFLSSQN